MNKKYYADITLDFDEMKYGISCEAGAKKQELIDLIKQFATERKLICDTKKKIFLKEGKEVGSFKIASKTF